MTLSQAPKPYLRTRPLFFCSCLPSFLTKTLFLLYPCRMAEPSTVKDTATLQRQALSTYEAAAALLQHKAGFVPDNRTPHGVDQWISNAYVQWALCDEFWKSAGIKKKVWNDLEYAILEKVARVDQDDVSWAASDFNELALHADYGLHIHPMFLGYGKWPVNGPKTIWQIWLI
ncbi:hypothetical protein EV421DRAFT_1743351 [Armillaria borealis]|uniref:Uncharacterized protein n=1 Tax=Armillaria borealis TaxID=47425 RepID=A0AA39IYF2_9AGAR|nr:hypothetical protein EV421DRAFT_1743351 [Armillaria borealis]